MNIKIMTHFMPWEIDHALLLADKLKQSIYNINENDTVYIDSALNLSSYSINWSESKLPKEFFIEKYNLFCKLIGNKLIHKPFIYDGNEKYGHLDCQKKVIESHIDAYIPICPDIDFSPSVLYYLIEYSKMIKNEYFIVTPQIFRCWDDTWDILVNEHFLKYTYKNCIDINIHDIRHQFNNIEKNISLFPINDFKFAGWFDLYSKNFYEKLSPVLDEWNGYGPWDFYSMNVCKLAKSLNVDIKQYVLKDEIIWFYDTGDLQNKESYGEDGLLKTTYSKFLSKNSNKKTQTLDIYNNINYHLNNWLIYAKNNKIIK